ncbi:serpentine type 7TM GPCR chemoreceptor srd domain-containing protein [Ditylenchus destructor]|uniref:Serpentine type 7TM GPCR chemoreceptor srd domain-containing protein n=1 Tax=Ditylenchus destructor TaxID=166010 RepID=A0AAD4MPI0_9BILA|nr:serpentine type 7TM GPCR chemoreceptor srd domain-containing protein [Ditylenchus destructor]
MMEGTVNTLSILFNVYLLYLIKYHSTFGVKLYQYLLTIDALLDLALSISAFIAQPVVITANGYSTMISNGFFAGRSASFDSFAVMVYLVIIHTNIIWIPVQFIYRYLLLCKANTKSKRSTIFVITIAVAQSAITIFITFCAFGEVREEFQPIGHHVLELNSWPNPGRIYVLGRRLDEWQLIVMLVSWNVTCGGSIFIVAWCENRIAKNFDQLTQHSTHSGTQKMHKEFQRALLAMAISPLVSSTIPALYFITVGALKLRPGAIPSALVSLCLSSVTLFNPLTTIICFRSYRQTTIRLLTCGEIGKSQRKVVHITITSKITINN